MTILFLYGNLIFRTTASSIPNGAQRAFRNFLWFWVIKLLLWLASVCPWKASRIHSWGCQEVTGSWGNDNHQWIMQTDQFAATCDVGEWGLLGGGGSQGPDLRRFISLLPSLMTLWCLLPLHGLFLLCYAPLPCCLAWSQLTIGWVLCNCGPK